MTVDLRMSDGPICDFCSSPGPAWMFPCQSYDLPPLPGDASSRRVRRSERGWAACEPCAELIRAGDRSGITRRGIVALHPHYPQFTTGQFRRRVELVQSGFWQERDPQADPIPFADWVAAGQP